MSYRSRHIVAGIALAAIVLVAGVAAADTIGSPLVPRTTRDWNWGGLFVYDIPFADAGAQVSDWAFYGGLRLNGPGTTGLGNLITPLLFEQGVGSAFTIVGIGTTRTNAATGVQAFAFGLVAGSDIVGAQTYFGWRDGNIDGSVINDGSIELDYGGGPGLYYYPPNAPTHFTASIAPGQVYTFTDYTTASRTYSVQATAVPEPASLLLLGTGLIGAVRAVRRKRG